MPHNYNIVAINICILFDIEVKFEFLISIFKFDKMLCSFNFSFQDL